MIEWKKGVTDWTSEIDNISMAIHHCEGHGARWFLTIPVANMKDVKLNCVDIKDAKKEALGIIKNFVKDNIVKWTETLILLEKEIK